MAKASPANRFTPVGDRVLVRRDPSLKASPGGIVLPEMVQEKPRYGTVIAAGPGTFSDGVRLPMQVKEGMRVIVPCFAEVLPLDVPAEDGSDLIVLHETDVLAIVNDR